MYETYRKLRNSLGYKDSDVAKGTGITKSTFSDWKTGRSIPKMDKLKKIALFLNTSVEHLTAEENIAETMTTYEIIINLCKQHNLAVTALEKDLGFGRGSIGKLKTGQTSAERLQKIANYFNVSVDYLMTGMEINTKEKYDKTTRIAQEILNNKYLQQLFNAAHDAPPEDLEAARALILALKKKGSK